jgi:hypothetical protein
LSLLAAGLSAGEDWKSLVVYVLLGYAASVAAYFGLWKPTGVADLLSKYLVADKMEA